MSTRPEILFPLFANIKTLPGVGPKIAASLESFKITRPRDLVFHLPYDIIDRRAVATVIDAPGPKILTVEVQIIQHFPPNIRGKPYRVAVKDSQTNINLIFFHAEGIT
jgi:ATP-dependent DNA helicase RecG